MTLTLGRRGLTRGRLRAYLDAFVDSYDYEGHLRRDPLQFVLAQDDARDREVVGLLAACLAYGIVDRVLHSVGDALRRLGPRPARRMLSWDAGGRAEKRAFRGFLHRMTGDVEMRALCGAVGSVLRAHGSLEALFAEAHEGDTIFAGLSHLVERLREESIGIAEALEPGKATWHRRRLRFLLPSPAEGGACKRLNLWMRWMIRDQRPDVRVWTAASPSQLVIPLDTHIVRLSRYLGFTRRANPCWKMAEEVTAALRALDPEDPLKYDFALCHLGISGDCLRRRDYAVCPRCPLDKACRL